MDKSRRDFIHRDAKKLDDMNLPFEIGAPKKERITNILHKCSNCGEATYINRFTVMYVCSHCKNLERINGT